MFTQISYRFKWLLVIYSVNNFLLIEINAIGRFTQTDGPSLDRLY